MAIGALGAGAQPVLQNPTQGVRVIGLFARTQTSSLAITMTGTVMVVLAWLLLGKFALGTKDDGTPAHRLTRAQLDRTLLLWIIPLSVAPPMFSRDVYSYLAQSEITARGMDPYAIGPAQALGVDDVLTRTVPTIWRDTPAPYGPLFLWMGRGISSVTGDNIVAGIFLHRLLALAGVALIVWAVPRLARRCGVAPVSALWLGAANPLLLLHLVAGVHNEALMLGLMLAGMEVALAAIESSEPIRGRNLTLLLGGCGVIALSATIKIPSLIALGFVGMALARRWGGGWRAVFAAAGLLAAVALAVTLLVSGASGLGFGWIHTLGTANAVRSWMSLPTSLGVITGFGGVLLGLGDHTTAVLSLTRPIAALVAAFVDVAHARRGAHRPAASGRGARRRTGGAGAAVPRRAAVVPAVGGDPARGLGDAAVLPDHRHRAEFDRQRDPDAERRRVPAHHHRPGVGCDRAHLPGAHLPHAQPTTLARRPGGTTRQRRTHGIR